MALYSSLEEKRNAAFPKLYTASHLNSYHLSRADIRLIFKAEILVSYRIDHAPSFEAVGLLHIP